MKVKVLIELLRQQSPDAEVLLSSDEEGHEYGIWTGYVFGNFEEEEGTALDPRHRMFNVKGNELSGDYIILYPR